VIGSKGVEHSETGKSAAQRSLRPEHPSKLRVIRWRRGYTNPRCDGKYAQRAENGEILAPRDADAGRSNWLREYTRGCGGKEEENGDTGQQPCVRDYHIRYYVSSDKLKAVD